jgi:hypothetical protein
LDDEINRRTARPWRDLCEQDLNRACKSVTRKAYRCASYSASWYSLPLKLFAIISNRDHPMWITPIAL